MSCSTTGSTTILICKNHYLHKPDLSKMLPFRGEVSCLSSSQDGFAGELLSSLPQLSLMCASSTRAKENPKHYPTFPPFLPQGVISAWEKVLIFVNASHTLHSQFRSPASAFRGSGTSLQVGPVDKIQHRITITSASGSCQLMGGNVFQV